MSSIRPRDRDVTVALSLLVLTGAAAVASLVATGQIGGRQIVGEVRIIESQVARFDRQVHAALGAGTQSFEEGDRGLCLGLAAAQQVAPGGEVVLYDERGSVIGRGALGGARVASVAAESASDSQVCAFEFSIPDVRRTDSLVVEVGGTRRATYAASEFTGRQWFVSIPVGS